MIRKVGVSELAVNKVEGPEAKLAMQPVRYAETRFTVLENSNFPIMKVRDAELFH